MYVKSIGDYKVIVATIAASASQSDEIDIGGHEAFALEMGASWNTAAITFLASSTSDGTFRKIVGDTGTEISVAAATNEMIALESTKREAIKPFRFIKIRSGTASSPVTQTYETTINVMVK
jgi:hypothetical protein